MSVFYQLLGNTIISTVTNMTVWFALIFYVYLETRSVIATSIVSGVYMVVAALSGFWFGSLVDRHRKKNVMIGSSAFSFLIYALGYLLYRTAPSGSFASPTSVRLWALVLLLLVGVLAGNVRGIALPALITTLIPEEKRDRANGLAGTATGIGLLITSAISGLLVAHSGMSLTLILAVAMMALSILHLLTLSIPEPNVSHADGRSTGVDIRGTLAIVTAVPGLLPLILFATFNNLLGGVYMGLMDAYGLSLVSVEVWGALWALLSGGFIIGGLAIARWGLGERPVRALFTANLVIWAVSSVFALQPSLLLLTSGMLIYMAVVPVIEAAEHTIMQKVVPPERQGRAFGFAQSVETAASPLATLSIGPIAELLFIPYMTTGAGVRLIGGWFGTGPDRGIALVFTITGWIGLATTLVAMRTKATGRLADRYAAVTLENSTDDGDQLTGVDHDAEEAACATLPYEVRPEAC